MTTVQELERAKGWEEYQKVEKQIKETGSARVYIYAVECCSKMATMERGFERFANESAILRATLQLHKVSVRKIYDPRGWHSIPAITFIVTKPEEFAKVWFDMQSTKYLHNSRTGCSYIISDGQSFDIQIMDEKHIASGM